MAFSDSLSFRTVKLDTLHPIPLLDTISTRELGTNHFFFIGGLPFLGLADNFFLKSNVFQTIFFITFCNENNFFTTILKNVTGFL